MRAIVLLHDAYGGRGGIAKFNRDLLEALVAYGDGGRVVVLPRLRPVDPPGERPEAVDDRTSAAGGAAAYMVAVLRCLAGPRPDLLVCGHINLLPFACLLRLRWRVPLVLVVHGIDAWQPPRRAGVAACARRVDAAIAVSELTRRRFLGWSGLPPARAHVLPNCIDADAFEPGPPRRDLVRRYGLEGRRVIMTLARLAGRERYKGVDEVLEVLPTLRARHPDLAYLVAGDGDDRPRLEAKAAALGLSDDVVFAGYVGEAEKADHYRLADAFVLAGRGEGFGIVLLEALACGVPCVASTLDASREALREGALGEIVDPHDPEDLARGIEAALRRPKGTVPEGLDHFSCAAFRRRLAGILEAVLAPDAGSGG